MHFTPTQRAIRLIVFSIGFVLFILIVVRSGGQASNPQFVKGKPLLAGISHVVGVLPQAAIVGSDVEQLSSGGAIETQAAAHATGPTTSKEHPVVPVTNPHAELPDSVSKTKKATTAAMPTVGRGEQP